MEKQVMALDLIKTYHDRQVVLNYYDEDDCLFKRDGFFFDCVKLENDSIIFIKDNNNIYQLSLKEYPFYQVLNDFSHHYLFYNKINHVYVYFPY